MTDDLFQRANDVELEPVAGVKLWRTGRRLRGECPVCGASKGKRTDGAFWADPDTGRWGCFSGGAECARGGDIVRLEQLLRGGTPREAAERLAGPSAVLRPRPVAKARRPEEPHVASVTAARLWHQAAPAAGTLVERYLRGRGIEGRVLAGALHRLRFHPRAFWGGEPGAWIHAPAMLAAVHTPAGPTGGVHLTYLQADGRGKADLSPAKRMWGPQMGADGHAGGAWLIGPRGEGVLIVGEGIETSLSAAILYGEPCRVAAALSLDRLQGGWLLDAYGRVNPEQVRIDPERPPFTWPVEAHGVDGVMIAVDRDMKPIRVKARKTAGGTYQRELTADERARICAGLAEQAWRAANPGLAPAAVRAISPGAGRDFNTQLMEFAA